MSVQDLPGGLTIELEIEPEPNREPQSESRGAPEEIFLRPKSLGNEEKDIENYSLQNKIIVNEDVSASRLLTTWKQSKIFTPTPTPTATGKRNALLVNA